jgi:hypothetical protein
MLALTARQNRESVGSQDVSNAAAAATADRCQQRPLSTALCAAGVLAVLGLLLAIVSVGVLARAFQPLWHRTRSAQVDQEVEP